MTFCHRAVRIILVCTMTYKLCLSQQPQKLEADIPVGADEFDAFLGDIGLPEDYGSKAIAPQLFPGVPGQPGIPGLPGDPKPPPTAPPAFDWRKRGVISSVRNQQRTCAACYAFASVGVLEAVIRIKYNDFTYTDLSEQHIIACDKRMAGCRGGSMAAFNFWKTTGPNTETCHPYKATSDGTTGCTKCKEVPYRVAEWVTAPMSDILFVKQLIMDRGPGYLSFKVYFPFYNYWRGYDGEVYKHPASPGRIRGGHAVQLLGWDDSKQAWLLQNGWGLKPPGPLGDGSFYFPYDLHRDLNFGVAFIKVKKIEDTNGGGSVLGKAPVKCENHVPCYKSREPRWLYSEKNFRYLSGCYCQQSVCKIDLEINGAPRKEECIYCADICGSSEFFKATF